MKNQQSQTGSSSIAWLLLLLFSWSLFQPVFSFAGGGGPTQPEATAFTPIGVSDMVDPFTGDFTYNIPLMDIEGYPINIAYNSGVTMDQEASWVGLGWNLNAGAIVRNLRGLPDDFKGDNVVKTQNIKPTFNMNVNGGVSGEIFGFKLDQAGVNLSLNASLGYSNYNGFNSSIGAGVSFELAKSKDSKLNSGFNLSGSSENGASFSPSLSLSSNVEKGFAKDLSKTTTIGTAFNSRAGLQTLSYGFSLSKQVGYVKVLKDKRRMDVSRTLGTNSLSGAFDMGLSQYMPTASHQKVGGSLAFQWNASATVFGGDGQGNIGVSISTQWLKDKTISTPSFGYMYHENGVISPSNQLDFNRDNDQPFSKYSIHLPSTFQTYDIFTVQAQGTGGSFRAQRNEVSYVFDAESNSFDIGASVGLETGFGVLSDVGVDIQIPTNSSYTGIWSNMNSAKRALKATPSRGIVPSFNFTEASESAVQSDNLMVSQFNGLNPEKLVLEGSAFFPRLANKLNQGGNIVSLNRNTKNTRELTNNQLYMLTYEEVIQGMGLPNGNTIYSGAKSHHIAEITQLGQDGRRYIFGLPAYNHFQEDVTFATGDGMYTDDGLTYNEDNSGIIIYNSSDASENNKKGIDNYYNSVKTPAYAHSFMLTSVLSDDYVDIDANGPSKNDLGSYVKFDYTKVPNHQWRSPMNANEAFYNEGMRSDKTDDKGSFTHGEKDLYYLQYVETKNYIAVFETFKRKDGYSAAGRDGGFTADSIANSKYLKSITLYSKAEVLANGNNLQATTPIQKVEFTYNYSLCKNYPANRDNATEGGKLTLTDIKFTYQNSKKMAGRGYHFEYNSNPNYNLKASDRWGTYKPNVSGSETSIQSLPNNAEFPYSEQNRTLADQYAAAWSLTKIKLPSGGEINVDYESDDYQFVQHKKAAQMFQIVGVMHKNELTNQKEAIIFNDRSQQGFGYIDLVKPLYGDFNPYLIFKMESSSTNISDYVNNGQQLYFRSLVKLNLAGNDKEKTEWVSGYGIVEKTIDTIINNVNYGLIKLEGEKLKDLDPKMYSPLIKQAILLGRSQLPRTINQDGFSQINMQNGEPSGAQAIKDIASSMVGAITSFKELVTGPNQAIFELGKGREFVPFSSWMRLNCVSGKKLGGGSRVKQIRISDNWDAMNGGNSKTYGQSFKYELEDGTSSGVASYEPQLGGDENPWHSAYIIKQKKRLAMDDKMYIEDPIMESQFPSPSVGYSRVVITDLNSENIGSHGSGKVVKEFYTAKDFPTLVKSTEVDILPKNSILPLLPKYQYLTANQGFSIELNDMHGKPKKESVYAQGQNTPLSTVEYIYKSEDLGLGGVANKRLKNEVIVIDENGNNRTETIGVRYDAVADFRESKTVSQVPKLAINTNSFIIAALPIIVPPIWPGYDRTTNRFRSATMNKTVQRFGILDKTVANQDGSIVETNNLAYDAQTGQVLVTQTTTNFNDKVYSLNYPAYWKYESFGQASKNIMYSYKATSINTNGFAAIPQNLNYFTEGDEVSVTTTSGVVKAWVIEKNANGIRLEDKAGTAVSGANATIKVIRSGYKNKQQTSMASMTTLDNPIDNLPTNQFSQVLNAGAVEFGQDWKTYCDCFNSGTLSNNPYVLGIKGSWRPIKSYTYLSGRTQTNFDGNTNIRKDGVFTSYSPFYKLGNGKWIKDGFNWTFVSEVTQFSPNGMTLETKDALGRYSSSLFSFNNTLTTAVAANSKMTQIASGSFEDLKALSCADQGYFNKAFNGTTQVDILAQNISNGTAHTGKTSIVVTPTTPVTFQNTISTCTVPNDCTLALACGTSCTTVNIQGGSAPYTLDVTPQGNATAELTSSNVISITMNTTDATCKQIIYVTDAKGCKAGIILTISGGSIQSQIIQI